MNELLNDYIGKAVMIIEPDAYDSDTVIACSDNLNTVAYEGYLGVLFILQVGDITAASDLTVTIAHASTGLASDAAAFSTDTVFATVDSDGDNEIYLLDIDLRNFTLTAGGILGAQTAAMAGACDFSLMAIPYGGTMKYPIDQENDVVEPAV